MAGAAIAIDDASATDTILSVKERVFAANRKMSVRRQRLVYSAGPRGIDPLADTETLGGAGVARDGSAELDVLLVDLTAAEAAELNAKVRFCLRIDEQYLERLSNIVRIPPNYLKFVCHSIRLFSLSHACICSYSSTHVYV
jgi:hypothetical protein